MAKLGIGANAIVTTQMDADLFGGLVGTGKYMLPIGRQMGAAIINNNTVRIYDGVMMFQGRYLCNEANTYDDFNIETGAQGEERYDVIGYRLYKNGGSELIENFVQKDVGETVSIEEAVLRDGAVETFVAMYKVKIEGLTIVELTPLYSGALSIMGDVKTFVEHQKNSLEAEINKLSKQIVSYNNKIELTSSSYFKINESKLVYNKMTGEVCINLVGVTQKSITAGTTFIMGFLNKIFTPEDMNIAVAVSPTSISSGAASAVLYKKTHDDARAIKCTVSKTIGDGYYLYASAHYFVEPGLVE